MNKDELLEIVRLLEGFNSKELKIVIGYIKGMKSM